MRLLILLVICTACAGPEEDGAQGPQGPAGPMGAMGLPGEGVVSGSRIKARYLVSPDGARIPAGYWDEKLKIRCAPGTVEGRGYCLPSEAIYFSAPTVFLDAACTVPAYTYAPSCTRTMPPTHVGIQTKGACGFRLYATKKEVTRTIYAVFDDCRQKPITEAEDVYSLTEVPLSDFVEFSAQ